jgi:hypothetical protein
VTPVAAEELTSCFIRTSTTPACVATLRATTDSTTTFSSGEIDLNLGMAMFVHELGHPWSLVTSGDPDQDHLHFEERGINSAQRLYESKKVSP